MISHRYARLKENPKDRLTYHSICLLEWEHGEYCTVVESAYLNGMGGYQGKSKCCCWRAKHKYLGTMLRMVLSPLWILQPTGNWYDDKDDGMTALYCNLPPEMIAPW